jgi:ATP-dependent Lon protease
VVLFPHVAMPLLVGRAASLAAVQGAREGEGLLLLAAQRTPDAEDPAAGDVHRTGVLARLVDVTPLPGGTVRVLVDALERVTLTRIARGAGGALAALWTGAPLGGGEAPVAPALRAAVRHALARFEEYAALHRQLPPEVVAYLHSQEVPSRQLFTMAAHLQSDRALRQRLLEAPTMAALAAELATVLAAEVEVLRLERRIDEQVRGTMSQHQREFYLQEQLRAIHKELGAGEEDEPEQLLRQVAERGLPEAVAARVRREIHKLRRTPAHSPEGAVVRGWVEWVLAMPWTHRAPEHTDVEQARLVLDGDHFGLGEVKERLLDHVAVLARAGRLPGPILCLVGPPGVGKTSLGRSIARALGRPFVRVALGGVRDEGEIRGHRRTYVGAMPGRIVQGMRRAGALNPVFLLDEVDKMGHDWRGDPAAALMEVLDPEQHHAFGDHYLDVDFDLSQVLFLTTANTLAGIPEPLRDRLEIVRIPGYLEQEKVGIAEWFLVPRQLSAHGVPPISVALAPDVLPAIIRGWTREAGVRELERRVARLARKLARRPAVAEGAPPMAVTVEELPALLGPPRYQDEPLDADGMVGVATGLAYTAVGGERLEIEVSVVPGRGRLQLTGTLGDVLKESASAALGWVRARATALGIPEDFVRTRDLHIHLPSGATPKDGPSAGIALATALVSALTGVPVRRDVALTGEVTLRGRVLPVGGIREKAMAARRHGVAHVVLPQGNARDLEELPAEVRDGVAWHPVRTMDEVLPLALAQLPPTEAR